MANMGQSWQVVFPGSPRQGRALRQWTAVRVDHENAPLVAHELFVALLGAAPAAVEITLSTAGPQLRITATSSTAPSAQRGLSRDIVGALSACSGVTKDGRGLWAQLTKETHAHATRTDDHDAAGHAADRSSGT